MRQQLAVVLSDSPKGKRLTKSKKLQVIETIQAFNGYKDPHILCSWLLFSGQQIRTLKELYTKDLWNCIRQTDYPSANSYLDGLKITHESFHKLLPQFSGKKKVLLILDPPYLCTRQDSYKQATYFDLIDFLRLINLTKPPYIFFSSTKSEFIRFIEYMIEDRKDNWQAFDGANRITVNASASYSGKYEDNLVYKF